MCGFLVDKPSDESSGVFCFQEDSVDGPVIMTFCLAFT